MVLKTVKCHTDLPTQQPVFTLDRENHGVCICYFDQLIFNAMLECSPSMKQMLLKLAEFGYSEHSLM